MQIAFYEHGASPQTGQLSVRFQIAFEFRLVFHVFQPIIRVDGQPQVGRIGKSCFDGNNYRIRKMCIYKNGL